MGNKVSIEKIRVAYVVGSIIRHLLCSNFSYLYLYPDRNSGGDQAHQTDESSAK